MLKGMMYFHRKLRPIDQFLAINAYLSNCQILSHDISKKICQGKALREPFRNAPLSKYGDANTKEKDELTTTKLQSVWG